MAEDIALGLPEGAVRCGRIAAVRLPNVTHLRKASRNLGRIVDGAVVDQDDLIRWSILRYDAFQALRQIPTVVVGGNEDGDFFAHGCTRGGSPWAGFRACNTIVSNSLNC